MKRLLYTFALMISLPIVVFTQGNVTQKLDEFWNADAGIWDFLQVDKWRYDEANREVYAYHEDSFAWDFVLEDRRETNTEYDAQGNLIQQITRSWSDSTWNEYRTDNQYDDQNRIIERLDKYSYSFDPNYSYQGRINYEYDDLENRKTQRQYSFYNEATDWVLNNQMDSVFNENGCLLYWETRNFDSFGNLTYHRKEVWTHTADCLPLTYEFLYRESETAPFVSNYKRTYVYSADGKKTTTTHERFNENMGTWTTDSVTELEVDDEGRVVRQYSEAYSLDYIDKWLRTYTYTDKGEAAVFTNYQTYNWLAISEMQLTQRDSFVYEYNDLDQLIYKEGHHEYYYPGSSDFKNKVVYKYNYYCDGQLKSETWENLPNINRTTYEYDQGGECLLAKKELELVIFPNPSDGNVQIRSNLLASPNAEVRVFSVLGQEVFGQKMEAVTERFALDLTDLPNGNYVISIIDGKKVISEKIYILK